MTQSGDGLSWWRRGNWWRCGTALAGYDSYERCELDRGHVGEHLSGVFRWPDGVWDIDDLRVTLVDWDEEDDD